MKQIKSCLKNLLINLKYYFVPLGICMFFIVIASSAGIPLIIDSVKSTFAKIGEQIGGAEFNWSDALSKLIEKVSSIDGSGGVNSYLSALTQKEWVVNTLTDVARALFGDSIDTSAIVASISDCATVVSGTVLTIVLLAVMGFAISFFVIMIAMRKSSAKTGWIKAILFSIVDTALFVLFAWIYLKFNPSQAWVKVLVNIGYGLGVLFISYVEAYFFYAFKKLPFKKVFNLKNVIFLQIGNIITLVLGMLITIIPILFVPYYGGFILAVPFVEIVFLVVHMNYEVYIKELVIDETKKAK